MPNQDETKSLRTEVLNILDRWQPPTVGDLIALLAEKRGISAREADLSEVVKELRAEGRLELELPPSHQVAFLAFLINPAIVGDFWGMLGSIVVLNAIIALPIGYWLAPLRWALGALSILLFPGYSIQMGLFPKKEDLLLWKRIVLAVALSIAATGFYATILDATEQGIILNSVLILFSFHTLIFSWIGLLRRFEAERKVSLNRNFPK